RRVAEDFGVDAAELLGNVVEIARQVLIMAEGEAQLFGILQALAQLASRLPLTAGARRAAAGGLRSLLPRRRLARLITLAGRRSLFTGLLSLLALPPAALTSLPLLSLLS